MNVYFSCSITGGRSDQLIYKDIVDHLLALGHDVPTAHLADPDIPSRESLAEACSVYERDVSWVKACGLVIAEVSTPSHGVGYEIALALELGKPVLCCYAIGRRVSKMITGNSHEKMKIIAYKSEIDLLTAIDHFLLSLPG